MAARSPATLFSTREAGNSTKTKRKAARIRKLSILVGVCGIFLLWSFDEGVPFVARSIIVPRILATVISDDADGDQLAHNVGPPVDEDIDSPLNLTSAYQHHEERMAERRLASPAPPSADIVPGNEYIVGIAR